MKQLPSILTAVALLFLSACNSAPDTIISGTVNPAVEPVEVRIDGSTLSTTSSAAGDFTLTGVPAGSHDLVFSSENYLRTLQVDVEAEQLLELGSVRLYARSGGGPRDEPSAPHDPSESDEQPAPEEPAEGDTPGTPTVPEEPQEPSDPIEEDPADQPPAPESFTIDLRFTGSGLTREYEQAFQAAADRWSDVILAGGSSVRIDKPAGACSNTPALSGTVKDLVIIVKIEPIDGPGGILGSAGPCILRRDGRNLPALGIINLDSADLAGLQARGQLVSTIMHEIGHVLGIGTLWENQGLLAFSGNSTSCTTSTVFSQPPVFRGDAANHEYGRLGGSGGAPVEDNYGRGTKCGHWRKGTFGNELMTGILTSGGTPLSRLTVASLADLGYTVAVDRAEAYQLPACNPSCLQPQSLEQFEEILLLPEYFTEPQ